MPRLRRIAVYPIKSLDPVWKDQVQVLPSGALEDDRRWAIVNEQGEFVNGKRESKVHQLRLTHFSHGEVSLQSETGHLQADLVRDKNEVENYLSRYFGYPVTLEEDPETGFPDDLELGGPTLLSKSSVEEVCRWYDGLPYEETWRRFRANLEIEDAPPFWEDQLYSASGTVPFSIGDVVFAGANPCARCIVPTRDPQSGVPIAGFTKTFMTRREQSLPDWAAKERFDHYYRLALNTILTSELSPDSMRDGTSRASSSNQKQVLHVGDEVKPVQ
ncbi:MOSC domain protein [Polystyrenella longa]|uniref:MOSC domain protein n=1 Tax=Polystyrenella longa TaxID=2528007 RepID=A0A518CSL9_9PLAN|nr:MOSC N-terminal beta barrel domain-containing protein [Polystyrenella longa]QDU82210.1 MOSC domain protein [Polystyrenella longa]